MMFQNFPVGRVVIDDQDAKTDHLRRFRDHPALTGIGLFFQIPHGKKRSSLVPARSPTRISPFINPTSFLEMTSPRPVPPYFRVVEPSAWLNASKSRFCPFSSMPMPVSRTSKRRIACVVGFADAGDGDDHLAVAGELDRVADEIVEDLAQSSGIAAQMHRHFWPDESGQLKPLAVGLRGEQVHRVVDDFAQFKVGDLEVEFARLDLGEIENVVDDDEERFAADPHGAGEFALLGRQVGHQQQVGHADDAVHRRANFVAHVGQELALHPVGRLRRGHGAS